MKIKELANEFLKAQLIIESESSSRQEKEKAMKRIDELSETITNFEDFLFIDDYIQKKLKT